MRTKHLLLVLTLAMAAVNLSANDDSCQPRETHQVIFGVVHDVAIDGDNVIIHLYREPYDVIAAKWQRVRSDDYELYPGDLQNQDNVEITGDFDSHMTVMTVRRIKLVSRIEHR